LQVILSPFRIAAILSEVCCPQQLTEILVYILNSFSICSQCGPRYSYIDSALQDFSVSSLSSHAFYLSPSKVTSSSIVFIFAYTAPIWSVIRFNFWASGNSQVQLNFFSSSNLTVSGTSAVVTTIIQQAFGPNDNPVIRTFLNGYQAQSTSVQVAVSPSNLQATTLSIKILLGPNTQINGIWLSWVAFSPVSATFSAYGGSVGRNSFVGSYNSDVSSNLYQNSYLLYGLTQVSINGKDPLAFSCQISNNFQLSLSSNRNFDSLGIVYIAAGNSPSKLCSGCGAANYAYENSCLTSCPLGTTANKYKDGGVACLGTAVTASSNSSQSSTSSASSSDSSAKATPQCPTHAFFNGNECACEVGYGYING